MLMEGKSWKFPNDISTDHIAPGRLFHLRTNLPELAKHVLEDAREDFAPNMKKGDFVVAGKNFGLGSSREHAPVIIKMAGVNAVLAKSFARIFFRNAINVGLPLVECNTDLINEGDKLEVDLSSGMVKNITQNIDIEITPLPDVMIQILNEGGLAKHIEKHGDFKLD